MNLDPVNHLVDLDDWEIKGYKPRSLHGTKRSNRGIGHLPTQMQYATHDSMRVLLYGETARYLTHDLTKTCLRGRTGRCQTMIRWKHDWVVGQGGHRAGGSRYLWGLEWAPLIFNGRMMRGLCGIQKNGRKLVHT
jgi:hypothetical protein